MSLLYIPTSLTDSCPIEVAFPFPVLLHSFSCPFTITISPSTPTLKGTAMGTRMEMSSSCVDLILGSMNKNFLKLEDHRPELWLLYKTSSCSGHMVMSSFLFSNNSCYPVQVSYLSLPCHLPWCWQAQFPRLTARWTHLPPWVPPILQLPFSVHHYHSVPFS